MDLIKESANNLSESFFLLSYFNFIGHEKWENLIDSLMHESVKFKNNSSYYVFFQNCIILEMWSGGISIVNILEYVKNHNCIEEINPWYNNVIGAIIYCIYVLDVTFNSMSKYQNISNLEDIKLMQSLLISMIKRSFYDQLSDLNSIENYLSKVDSIHDFGYLEDDSESFITVLKKSKQTPLNEQEKNSFNFTRRIIYKFDISDYLCLQDQNYIQIKKKLSNETHTFSRNKYSQNINLTKSTSIDKRYKIKNYLMEENFNDNSIHYTNTLKKNNFNEENNKMDSINDELDDDLLLPDEIIYYNSQLYFSYYNKCQYLEAAPVQVNLLYFSNIQLSLALRDFLYIASHINLFTLSKFSLDLPGFGIFSVPIPRTYKRNINGKLIFRNISSKGQFTPWHIDSYDNEISILLGCKVILISPPNYTIPRTKPCNIKNSKFINSSTFEILLQDNTVKIGNISDTSLYNGAFTLLDWSKYGKDLSIKPSTLSKNSTIINYNLKTIKELILQSFVSDLSYKNLTKESPFFKLSKELKDITNKSDYKYLLQWINNDKIKSVNQTKKLLIEKPLMKEENSIYIKTSKKENFQSVFYSNISQINDQLINFTKEQDFENTTNILIQIKDFLYDMSKEGNYTSKDIYSEDDKNIKYPIPNIVDDNCFSFSNNKDSISSIIDSDYNHSQLGFEETLGSLANNIVHLHVLKAGDSLVIPKEWWHCVLTKEFTIAESRMSVEY